MKSLESPNHVHCSIHDTDSTSVHVICVYLSCRDSLYLSQFDPAHESRVACHDVNIGQRWTRDIDISTGPFPPAQKKKENTKEWTKKMNF